MQLKEKLEENIFYFTDVIKNPQEIIDIIERLDTYPGTYPAIEKWQNWGTSSNDGVSFGRKKDFDLSKLSEVQEELGKDAYYVSNTIKESIGSLLNKFCSQILSREHFSYSENVRISKYVTGGSMGPHYDTMDGSNKIEYSVLIYYNDNYDGGEVSFMVTDEDVLSESYTGIRLPLDASDPSVAKDATVFIKPEAGSALIFPSSKPYYHQVHLIRGGEKYITPAFIFNN